MPFVTKIKTFGCTVPSRPIFCQMGAFENKPKKKKKERNDKTIPVSNIIATDCYTLENESKIASVLSNVQKKNMKK